MEPEIDAILKTHDLLSPLEDESKIRVIQWLISKFQLNLPNNNSSKPTSKDGKEVKTPIQNGGDGVPPAGAKSIQDFESVAECFAEASPNVDWEKALVIAAYFQVKNGLASFTSFQVNQELKNLGYASANITAALSASIERKPQFILQLRKDGTSRQAKKMYKVSAEGIKHVNAMIAKTGNDA